MHFILFILIILLSPSLWENTARAEIVYQAPIEFVSEAFSGTPPETSLLILSGERRKTAAKILDHSPSMIRVRYWLKNNLSAWVLEEIGKSKPITAGFIIEDGYIKDVRILIYRESHGDEVRHDFFTKQFDGSTLDSDMKLTKTVDGISGATLSVGAIKRLSTLALYFDKEARKE